VHTHLAQGLTQNVEFLLRLAGTAHPDAADTPDANGDTPLHAAACNGHDACVELLLRHAKFPQVCWRLVMGFVMLSVVAVWHEARIMEEGGSLSPAILWPYLRT
jgi:ankyrin repeat protein